MSRVRAHREVAEVEGPDLFVSYNSLNRAVTHEVRRLLRDRDVASFLDCENLTPGLPWFEALETAIARSRAVAVFIGKEGLGPWQRREMTLALDRQGKAERDGARFPVVPVLLPQADLDKAPAFLLLNTMIDLRADPGDPGELDRMVRAIRGEAPSADSTTGPSPPAAVCPYRGLRAFREEDAPLYFGPEAFGILLLEKVSTRPLVAVVGPSGSGKSSVAQAGLLPLLRRRRPPAATWDSVLVVPGRRPFHSLASALVATWAPEASLTDRMLESERLGNALSAGELAAEVPIAQAREATRADRLLVILDQFEELFTLTPEADRKALLAALLPVAESGAATLLLTLRADFYGQAIDLSRDLSDLIQAGLVNLGPMRRDELRRAVERPASAVGLGFEAGLVDRILDHVEGQPGQLPLLEFALTELCARRSGGRLGHGAYDQIGGIEGAIGERAEETFGRLDPARQQAALRVFTRLVRVSAANEEGADTRRRVPSSELDLDAATGSAVRAFVEARLLVTGRDESTGEETVEVAHEALIRNWGRLKDRLDEDRAFLLWRQRLAFAIGEWRRSDRDDGTLLRGAPLIEARRWARDRPSDLIDRETGYIRLSHKASQRPHRWAVAAATVAALGLLAWSGWFAWTRTAAYQIGLVKADAARVLDRMAMLGDRSSGEWLFALALESGADEALEAADRISNPAIRGAVLGYVADELAASGRSDEALTIARRLDDPARRFQGLGAAARALAEAGRKPEALRVAREGLEVALRREGGSRHGREINDAAGLVLDLESVDEILADAGRIGDAEIRDEFLADVSSAASNSGRFDAALAIARRIGNRDHRTASIAMAVGDMAKAGHAADAQAAAREALELSSSMEKGLILDSVVLMIRHLADAGFDEALELVRQRTRNPTLRSDALCVISLSKPAADRRAEAEAAAREAFDVAWKIEDAEDRFDAMFQAARAVTRIVEGRQDDFSPADRRRMFATAASLVVASGHAHEALEVARRVRDPVRQTEAITLAALALAEAGDRLAAEIAVREALEAAPGGGVLASLNPAVGLGFTCLVLAGADLADAVLAAARGLEDPADRCEALSAVAEVLGRAGRPEEANRLAEEVRKAAGSISSPERKGRAFGRIVPILAAAGLVEESFAEVFRNPLPSRDDAIRDAARVLVEVGRGDQVRQFAAQVHHPNDRFHAQFGIASGLAALGRVDEAIAVACQVEDERNRPSVFMTIVHSEHAGCTVEMADRIEDPANRDQFLAAFEKYLRTEDLDSGRPSPERCRQALEVARRIEGPSARAWALRDAASPLIEAGAARDAAEAAEEILGLAPRLDDYYDKLGAAEEAAKILAHSRLGAESVAAMRRVQDPFQRCAAFRSYAQALVESSRGDEARTTLAEALRVALAAPESLERSRMLEDLVPLLAEAGLAEEALEAAHHVEEPNSRIVAMIVAAEALAHAGRADEAREIALTIDQPEGRSKVLAAVAASLAREGAVRTAREAAEACTLPTDELDALASILAERARRSDPRLDEVLTKHAIRLQGRFMHAYGVPPSRQIFNPAEILKPPGPGEARSPFDLPPIPESGRSPFELR